MFIKMQEQLDMNNKYPRDNEEQGRNDKERREKKRQRNLYYQHPEGYASFDMVKRKNVVRTFLQRLLLGQLLTQALRARQIENNEEENTVAFALVENETTVNKYM